MTARNHELDRANDVSRVCTAATDGRRAVRALATWCESFQLTEPEFQVLRLLRGEKRGFDQTTLARRLAYSPAQVSATVERLRARGWIAQEFGGGDRRRNLWQLTVAGDDVVVNMLAAAIKLHVESAEPPREAAA